MKDNDASFLAGVIVASIAWVTFGFFTISTINKDWRKQTANHGCAHFYIDQNQDVKWDWN